MTISDKAIQKVVPKKATGIQYESKLHKTASQYREYQSDPISFVDKYGEGAVEKLMAELNRPIGVTDENVPITTREHLDKKKKGGRIKYQSKGKVTSDKDADIRLAWRYAKAEAAILSKIQTNYNVFSNAAFAWSTISSWSIPLSPSAAFKSSKVIDSSLSSL